MVQRGVSLNCHHRVESRSADLADDRVPPAVINISNKRIYAFHSIHGRARLLLKRFERALKRILLTELQYYLDQTGEHRHATSQYDRVRAARGHNREGSGRDGICLLRGLDFCGHWVVSAARLWLRWRRLPGLSSSTSAFSDPKVARSPHASTPNYGWARRPLLAGWLLSCRLPELGTVRVLLGCSDS
jgi:hypothetical protein